MGLYYNKTETPLPVTLLSGGSLLLRPRSREWIHGENESSPALLLAVSKGHIVKLPEASVARQLALESPPPPATVVEIPVELPPPAESQGEAAVAVETSVVETAQPLSVEETPRDMPEVSSEETPSGSSPRPESTRRRRS
jgi:hypothetical protein